MNFAVAKGFVVPQELREEKRHASARAVPNHNQRKMPFVWIFGRAFWTVSLYGANVYVENVMSGLQRLEVRERVTGRFVLYVAEDEDLNVRLGLHVELENGVEESQELKECIADVVEKELVRVNSEYAGYVPKDRRAPVVTLHSCGSPERFPPGVKHKYVLQE